MNKKSSKPKYQNKSLFKALSIVDMFNSDTEQLSASKIAENLDTSPGSIYPTLYTLEKFGYLERNGNKKYTLGLRFLEKGNLILNRLDLREIAKPYLRKLADNFRGNAHLAVFYEFKVMYLHREEGFPSVTIQDIVGRRVPAYCTALGKVLLAHLSPPRLEEYLNTEELEPLTANTITQKDKLKEELKKVRKRGFAVDDEEFSEGNLCIAVPIQDFRGDVNSSISVSLPRSRYKKSEITEVSNPIRTAGRKISRELGFTGE